MTKSDVFVSVGFVDETDPRKHDPIRRYYMRIHEYQLDEIMNYLHKKSIKFDPVRRSDF